MAGANKVELVKFIKDEISETETALGFVVSELGKKTNTQFNRVYNRKKSEYEGMLSVLYAILDLAEGREIGVDNGEDSNPA